MRITFKLPKTIFLIPILLLGINHSFSQNNIDTLHVKIHYDATNISINNKNITNNSTLLLSFEVPPPFSNHSFSYTLNGLEAKTFNNPISEEDTSITFVLPRKDFNKPDVNEVTFKIFDTSGTLKGEVTAAIKKASLAKGNIIDDAIALRNAKDDDQLIIDILSFYANKELDYNTMNALINANPYLSQVFAINNIQAYNVSDIKKIDKNIKGTLGKDKTLETGAHSGGSSAGVDVTKYANAMAEIMIDHAKEELTIAFFNRFKKFITDYEEFRVLFPKTTDKLQNLLSYKYPEMIKALRVVFLEDIRMIAFRIDDVFALPKYVQLTTDYPEITIAIRSLRLVHQLETGGLNAAGVLNAMSNFSEWDNDTNSNKFKNIGNTLKAANAINLSISKVEKNKIELHDTDKIVKLLEDEVLFKIYMGLLYEKENSASNTITFIRANGTPLTFLEVLSSKKEDLFFFQNKIQEFVDLSSIVKNTIKDMNGKSGKLTNENRCTYISNSIDVIEYAFSLYTYFDTSLEVSEEYISVLRLSNAIYKNVYEQKYNAAISNTIDLFTKLLDLKNNKYQISQADLQAIKKIIQDKELIKFASDLQESKFKFDPIKINNLAAAVKSNTDLKNKITSFLALAASDIADNENYNNFIIIVQKLKPYALFMANMVEAKDEKEIKAALDAVILPVGSSSIKKNSDFNFNIQSYLGARLSFTDPKNVAQNTWNDKFALSAPIGLSISYGLDNNWGALSLFVPFLDLGAIVDYKLKYKDEGTSTESIESKDYTIELGQIFSPGIYAVYGWGANIPLSIGFGGQYGPGLSKIDADNNTEVSNPYWKWNAFLSVDIPLFNLANKAKVK